MYKFIINRRVLISMFFTALTLLGYISYRNLSVELIPNVELPFLFVQVNSSRDMDPLYMEKEAVIPLEGAVGTLENIEKIVSTVPEFHRFDLCDEEKVNQLLNEHQVLILQSRSLRIVQSIISI